MQAVYPRLTKSGNIVEQCKSCGNVFVIEKENLEFYRKHGLTPPKTCPTCLLIKHAKRNSKDGSQGMLNILPDFKGFRD